MMPIKIYGNGHLDYTGQPQVGPGNPILLFGLSDLCRVPVLFGRTL